MIEAANAEEEALAIAVVLREAVHDGKTAALVTPDRALGHRVLAALKRWNIVAEDSGGDALADTPAGIFARLAAEAALGGLAPVTLLALLKHPLLRLGNDYAAATLERAILRGPRPRPGTRGLAHALQTFRGVLEKFRRGDKVDLHRSDPRIGLNDTDAGGGYRSRCQAQRGASAAGKSRYDRAPAQRAGRPPSQSRCRVQQTRAAFAGPDGTKLADALDELATSTAAAGLLVEPDDYAELFAAALAGRVVRRRRSRASACAFSAPSKRASPRAIASCSAVWSRALGRRRAAPTPGLAGRCGSRSASICRSVVSGFPRTISRNSSAPAKCF